MFFIFEISEYKQFTLHLPLRDKNDRIMRFNTQEQAEIDRIYYQPEYDNPLLVKGKKVVEI